MPDVHTIVGAYTRPYYTLASLPSAIGQYGEIAYILDSTLSESAGTGSIAAGGGNIRARVMSDGIFWRIYGANEYNGGAAADGPINLLTSQDLGSAYWTLSGFTNVANQLNETAATSVHTFGITTPLTRPAGTGIYKHSVDLVKVGTDQRFLALGLYATGLGSGSFVYFDILNGVESAIGNYGGFSAPTFSIVSQGSSKWRCTINVDCTGSALSGLVVLEQDTTPIGTFTYAGNTADGYQVSNLALYQLG